MRMSGAITLIAQSVTPLPQIPTMIHPAGIRQSHLSLSQYTPIDSPSAKKPGSIGTLVKYKGEQPNTPPFIFLQNEMHPFSNPKFVSVILNGIYSRIPLGGLDDVPGYGRGFIWQPPIRAGATVVIVAGDLRGNATGGALTMRVGSGTAFAQPVTYWTGDCPPPNGTISYPPVGDKWVEPISSSFTSLIPA